MLIIVEKRGKIAGADAPERKESNCVNIFFMLTLHIKNQIKHIGKHLNNIENHRTNITHYETTRKHIMKHAKHGKHRQAYTNIKKTWNDIGQACKSIEQH